ncbi:MAG: choice-of-anchor D domain-containing protein, partial [Phycisphaerae bacterium]
QFSIDTGGGAGIIAPGATRNVQVSFNPTSLGAKSASLEIVSNDPDEATVVVNSTGNGVGAPTPDIAVLPASHDYGNVIETTSVAQVFEVSNAGGANLNVSATSIVGPDGLDFAITSGGGAFVVTPGGSQNVTVTFTPSSAGAKSASLRISSDDPDESQVDIALSGTGVAIPAGSGQVVFEEQVMGGSGSSSTVSTATPISGVAGHLYLAAITSKPNEVVLDVTGLGLTWQQVDFQCGGRKATSVSIWQAMGSPGAAGVVTATLAGAPENSAITVVRYSGADPINPTGSMVSGNTNGEDGTCGGGLDNSAYSFNLTTSGNGSLIFGAIAMRNRRHTPGPDYFERKEFAQGSGGGTAGLAIVEREVTTPATVSFDGTFSKNVDWAVVAVELKAAPVGDAPDITVLPPAHDFGDVVVSSPASKIFEVRNDGTENLSVSTTSLQGPNAADFSIVSGGGSFVLVPAASRNIEVSFTPAALGARSASLRLVSNDPDEGTFDVALSGTGVGPPAPDIAVTPASHDYGDVVVNTSAVKVFAVQNVGNADLSLT